jgi:hypothetical protein
MLRKIKFLRFLKTPQSTHWLRLTRRFFVEMPIFKHLLSRQKTDLDLKPEEVFCLQALVRAGHKGDDHVARLREVVKALQGVGLSAKLSAVAARWRFGDAQEISGTVSGFARKSEVQELERNFSAEILGSSF